MKRILKTLFILFAAISTFFVTNKSEAATFTVLDLGAGKSIISPNYMTWDVSSDVYIVRTTGAFQIKKGEVFAVYGSYYFIGDISRTTGVSYRIYNDSGSYKDYNAKWQRGGWYGTAFLENNTGNDGYIEILDFGVPYGMLTDDVVEEVEVRRTSAVGVFNFDGYRYCFGSKEYNLASDAYTIILSDNETLTEEYILSNFESSEYGSQVQISIKENNYKKEAGNYKVTIEAKDGYQNVYTYDLNVLVYSNQTPTILGLDSISLYLSEFSEFSEEKFLSAYIGSYYDYSYTLSITEESLKDFYHDYALCSNTTLTIECLFNDGTKTSKTVEVLVFDDVLPELFVKKIVYLTDYVNTLSIGDIIILIKNGLSQQNINAENISLIGIEELPQVAGKYDIDFSYDDEGEKKIGELNLVLKDSKEIDKYVNTILTKTENVKTFTTNNLIQIIEKELINKGINASNIILTSEENIVPAIEGDYEIKFTYDEGNITQNGTLTLTLTKSTDSSTKKSYTIYYIFGIISIIVIGIGLITYKKKRQHR